MINQPLVSILVANYNNGKYFKDCYDSLISQTFTDWECIIVDDCSTDDSLQTIQSLTQGDQRFKIIKNQENRGAGYTKRICAESASAKFSAFLDPDDALVPNALQFMHELIQKYPNNILYYSNFINCNEHLAELSIHKNKIVKNNDFHFLNLKSEISHFVMYETEKYKNSEGINPFLKRAVDQDLYLKLYELGNIHYIDKELYLYRIHENGISTSSREKALYWQWVVLNDTAKRRNINLENLFVESFVPNYIYAKNEYILQKLKKSRWIKWGKSIGTLKNIDI